MGVEYKYDAAENILYTKFSGNVGIDDLRSFAEMIEIDLEEGIGCVQIVDTEEKLESEMNVRHAMEMLALGKRIFQSGILKGAVIYTPKPSHYWQTKIAATIFSNALVLVPVRTREEVEAAVAKIRMLD